MPSCILNITPYTKQFRFNGNDLIIPPYTAINRVKDKAGQLHPYRCPEILPPGEPDDPYRRLHSLEYEVIPDAHLKHIATTQSGVVYLNDRLVRDKDGNQRPEVDMASALIAGINQRIDWLKEAKQTYERSRIERQQMDGYVPDRLTELNPRTQEPFTQGYEREIKLLQQKLAEWQREGFPTMFDIMDVNEEPELQQAVERDMLLAENAQLKEEQRTLRDEMALMREEMERFRKQMGTTEGERHDAGMAETRKIRQLQDRRGQHMKDRPRINGRWATNEEVKQILDGDLQPD